MRNLVCAPLSRIHYRRLSKCLRAVCLRPRPCPTGHASMHMHACTHMWWVADSTASERARAAGGAMARASHGGDSVRYSAMRRGEEPANASPVATTPRGASATAIAIAHRRTAQAHTVQAFQYGRVSEGGPADALRVHMRPVLVVCGSNGAARRRGEGAACDGRAAARAACRSDRARTHVRCAHTMQHHTHPQTPNGPAPCRMDGDTPW